MHRPHPTVLKRAAFTFAVIVAAAVTWWTAGDRIRAIWPRVVQPLSPHERYARALESADLDQTAIGRAWNAVATTALEQAHPVRAPFSTEGTFNAAAPSATAWRFVIARGRRIEIDVEWDSDQGDVFIDLFRLKPEATRPAEAGRHDEGRYERMASASAKQRTLHYEPADDGEYVVRVQPELLAGGRYTVQQRAVATLQFPVSGASVKAVQSVFGDDRDGGARSHQGVDIFAPRGTPALAAADGWVTGATTNRLGGNVVWIWDPSRGQALYYAHLDRQDVSPGTRVKAGEVVGRVGNTGNARTTPPHLHFGIYRPLEGAIDPLPFICDAPCHARGMAYAR
jgi:murein DD-endopeptidase MepM/ murein hydrolase activator NlpD